VNTESGRPQLVIEDLEVVYGHHIPALRGVGLHVDSGEIVALLGGNGAGKTTLLRAITGLLRFHEGAVTGGRIELGGEDITRAGATRIVEAGLAQVMEGGRVFDEMTVEDNLATGAVVRRDRKAMARRRNQMYDLFPVLRDRRKRQAGYLSGGEQQMLAIGRALMSSPSLLVLDEPSHGLAPLVVTQIRDVVEEINRNGTTVLLAEQNAAMAFSISARAYLLQNGGVALEGPTEALRDDPTVQALYLGTTADGDRASYRESRQRQGSA
jgi:branched-chain amino acid transport system ATP-binding protein